MSRKYKDRDYYPFIEMNIGQSEVIKDMDSKEDAIRVRCAVHTIAYNHQRRFKTKTREMDSGLFELSVRRVE
jgi:hypothetical protein